MIGIFGGTFDPIHYGHLRPALEVQRALTMQQVRFVPCFIPVHREEPGAASGQRLAMLQLAVEDVPGFVVDTRELDREGPSYMVDTLASLRDEFGDESLVLIMGQDAFAKLDTWYQWQRLNDLAHILVMTRPGGGLPTTGPLVDWLDRRVCNNANLLRSERAGRIWLQEVTQLDISATKIRAFAKQDGFRFLTPEPVREYIEAHGLYC